MTYKIVSVKSSGADTKVTLRQKGEADQKKRGVKDEGLRKRAEQWKPPPPDNKKQTPKS